MRTFLLLAALLLGSCASAPASEVDPEILEVAQAFLDVIETRDTARGAELAIPGAMFVNVRMVDGKRVVRQFNNEQWLRSLEQGEDQYLEEFTGTPTVLMGDDMAVLWSEYTFAIDGKLSHTGIDALQFVLTDDGWKIAGGTYSVVPTAEE